MDPELPRLVALLALLAIVTLAAGRLKTPPPVLLAAAGLVAALIPGLPHTPLHPDLILVFFLPPLLYADAFQTSWVDFRRWLRPILMLAIGLVIATTLTVGLVAQAFLPGVSPAACFVLGAVVSPTDTVAVQAVIERLRVPRRITAILGGESLVNDATGLVAVQVGVAVIASGTFELGPAALEFARIAGLGVVVGVAVGAAFAWINGLVNDVRTLFALSLLSPYATYWLAHLFDASGVLAVVVAGFVVSWRIHRLHADARVELYASWDNLVYVLNGLCFLLVGLEAPHLLRGMSHRQDLVFAALAVSAAVIATRIAWCFPAAYVPLLLLPRVRKREGGLPNARGVLLVSWAGVRGAVSLAAALALPADFPGRAEIVVCAMIVVLCTLLAQGLTLTPLIHLLGLRGDDDTADEIRHAREAYLQAGIDRLDEFCSQTSCPIEVFHLRSSMVDELETLRDVDSERRKSARARLSVSQEVRRAVVDAQRTRLLALRDQGRINDMTYMELLLELDRQSLAMQATAPA